MLTTTFTRVAHDDGWSGWKPGWIRITAGGRSYGYKRNAFADLAKASEAELLRMADGAHRP